MEVMFERVAGIDIGKATLTVCVRTPAGGTRRRSETRTFKTTTGSLKIMRDWLLECGVTIAALESTSATRTCGRHDAGVDCRTSGWSGTRTYTAFG